MHAADQMEKMKMISSSSSVILDGLIGHNGKKDDDDDDDDGDDGMRLPGFRFHPTDEELVGFYLRRKVEKKTLCIELIKHIDIYKYDPWDLPKVSTTVGDKEWYFFCIRERKYRNSIRPNRVTGSGFWKATGIDKPIYSISAATANRTNECIGLKKSLVFYKGSAGKGNKTDWMMHEFRLPVVETANNNSSKNSSGTIPQQAEIWTLCRIFKRNISYKQKYPQNCGEITSSSHLFSMESDNTNREKYKTFGTSSMVQRNGKIPIILDHHMDEITNRSISGSRSSITQESFVVLSPSFPNSNGNETIQDRNWDEVFNLVEFDPSLMYDYFKYPL